MPRRKKSGQSPARAPGGSPERGSLGHSSAHRDPAGSDGAMATNFPPSASLSSSAKQKIVSSMQEMFSHLDPEVLYIVLSEADFKVENAMDSLLELSVAAEVAAPPPSRVSGFERTAAALLSPRRLSGPGEDSSRPSQLLPPLPTSPLTEDLDRLVDQELQALTSRRGVEEALRGSQYLPVGASLCSPPPLPSQQQVLPELLQASQQTSLDQLCVWGGKVAEQQQQQQSVVNFTHLMTETAEDQLKPPLDLATSGRPSAFQRYKKQQDTLGNVSLPWNPGAPPFSPRVHGTQGPVFITPVAQSPSVWSNQAGLFPPWLGPGPASGRAPLRPAAAIPKSWALPAAPQPPAQHSRLRLEGKVLVMLRGAPGSGKSTLARALVEHNPGGVALSTDDYFSRNGVYQYDPAALGEAHEWNHKQAKEAFDRGANPIIIDNTNMQGWEMKPYVAQALKHGYKVLFREPDTWWKNKPRELERRNSHNVPVERIRRMLDNYERFVTVQSIMGSRMPETKPLVTSKTPCPDLVGLPGWSAGCETSRLYSSLPDVSSLGRSSGVGMLDEGSQESTESLNFQPTGTVAERAAARDRLDDVDLGELDSGSEAQSEWSLPTGDQSIPDCIVESVMRVEDPRGDETPVDFSKSTAQRVRRERPSRRSCFDGSQPTDLVKDTNQSDGEAEGAGTARDGGEKGRPPVLDFLGDWPSAWSLEQRPARSRGGSKDGDGKDEERVRPEAKSQPGPDVTEFQKLLDLIQTGAADIRAASSGSSSLSQSSLEELEEEEAAAVKSSRGELPDCVLDWKAADSCQVRGPTGGWDGIARGGNEAASATGGKDKTLGIGSESAGGWRGESRVGGRRQRSPASTRPDLTRARSLRPCFRRQRRAAPPQTDPRDFALLWRLNRGGDARDPPPGGVAVLSGDSSRFVPDLSSAASAAVAVHPSAYREVPYQVSHEKGTQVEETECAATQDSLESLRILSRHFKLVSFDTLEDLYDKCSQDLEWTTNLLLDSGERFFREDDEGEEDDGAGGTDEGFTSALCAASGNPEGTPSGPDVHVEHRPNVWPQGGRPAASESHESADKTEKQSSGEAADTNKDPPGSEISQADVSVPHTANEGERRGDRKATPEARPEPAAFGGSFDDGAIVEESGVGEMEEEIASMDEVHRLLQAELDEMERQQEVEVEVEEETARSRHTEERRGLHLDIRSVELRLPTEVALQLIELFGPVGADPGSFSTEDYAVQMDLNMANLLHQKWKETIQVNQLESMCLQPSHWGESQGASPVNQPDACGRIPFMDHWNAPRPHVSLRDIIKEEQALQENVEKVTLASIHILISRADLDRRDGAALLKEDQLFSLFPTIDRHFLQDIFRDHNYSLTQTELFLRSLLEEEPVKTVVAPEFPRSDHLRAASKEREKSAPGGYQDTEEPEYEDFRAEATQQRARQLESFSKAAEAYKQGSKEVAAFYAQQGHLHGQRMHEANHRAAVQIFERVNASLLPNNILDLHGLHVDEALQHLAQVLQDKTTGNEQHRGLCRPQLSVITGRGNHSRGGVARIRPAVIDYLTNKHYRFAEPKPGLVLVSLK
uniref:NEDD4 binding protein 2 n=1 Tax=Gasterosteus aculeatus aculeatus TaxID=481459 RepID=A0AAQ4Q3Q5_GASAC